jgi:uncharacterized NAD(P)/FAD-binding protein YdhS
MLAVQLLRRSSGNTSVVLIERAPVLGRGVAYGTQYAGHLLNVRAKDMSAYPESPDHFLQWAQHEYDPSARAEDFLPRRVYGQYISSQLREAVSLSDGEFCWIQSEAVALSRRDGRAVVQLKNGDNVVADQVVLALGNFPPADPRFPGKPVTNSSYVSNPWSTEALANVAELDSVLLIGSGLTSVDLTLELRARGFKGTVHILSRRGLLPQRHKCIVFGPTALGELPRTVRGLFRMIRAQVKVARAQGSDWRQVIDSLRPATQQIWMSLPHAERRRFLRHLRTYWDVHRHRIAESIADDLDAQLQTDQIVVHAGRIEEYRQADGAINITYRERKTRELKTFRVERVLNCTGPEGDYRRVASPLLRDLMSNGLAEPDELSLGLAMSEDGALLNDQGAASTLLYALGPLRKGISWESVAVPELRVQVAALANLLSGSPCLKIPLIRSLESAATARP